MNNKGFAITTILYGTLILFLMLLLSMLGILSTYNDRLEMLSENMNGARFNVNYVNILEWVPDNELPSTDIYFDKLYEEYIEIVDANDKVITIKSNDETKIDGEQDDRYGIINYKVELEENETYYFSCGIEDGIKWGGVPNTVEAYLIHGKNYYDGKTEIRFESNNNYKFTAKESEVYWLRLDINKSGEATRKFSNIKVLGKKKVLFG